MKTSSPVSPAPKPALSDDDHGPWYRQRWPWLLMAGPAIVVVAGIGTAWLAIDGADPLVADDYYKVGKAINQELGRDQVAASREMRATLQIDATAGMATVKLESNLSAAQMPNIVRMSALHTTLANRDISLELPAVEPGLYKSDKLRIEPGNWVIQLEDASRDWRLKREVRTETFVNGQVVTELTPPPLAPTNKP